MRYKPVIRSGSIAWSSLLLGRGVRARYPVQFLSECELYPKDLPRKIYLMTRSYLITFQQLALGLDYTSAALDSWLKDWIIPLKGMKQSGFD